MTADALLKNTLPDVRSARGYSEATLAIHREYVREATLNRRKALSENIPTSRTLSTESTFSMVLSVAVTAGAAVYVLMKASKNDK